MSLYTVYLHDGLATQSTTIRVHIRNYLDEVFGALTTEVLPVQGLTLKVDPRKIH